MTTIAIDVHDRICQDLHQQIRSLIVENEKLRAALAEPTTEDSSEVEPVQEPVAWRYKKEGGGWFVSDNEPQYVEQWNDIEEIQPLYTAPPQRKPLTDEEIERFLSKHELNYDMVKFARAIERAHGIGGQQ